MGNMGSCSSSLAVGRWLAVCTLGLSALVGAAAAQDTSAPATVILPDAPAFVSPWSSSTVVVTAPTGVETPVHAFWDRENIVLFSGVAVMRGLDYASTKNFLARGRKEILLPQDVVENSAGFAALEAAATGTSIGISYLFHRTGHHTLERWVSVTHLSVTAFGDARNYALKTRKRN